MMACFNCLSFCNSAALHTRALLRREMTMNLLCRNYYVRRELDSHPDTVTNKLPGAGVQTMYVHSSITVLCRSVVQGHAALKTLVLAMSGLSTTGAIAVARLLARNSILTVLDISFCRIRDTGAMVIARALAVNTSLTTLTVSLSHFGH